MNIRDINIKLDEETGKEKEIYVSTSANRRFVAQDNNGLEVIKFDQLYHIGTEFKYLGQLPNLKYCTNGDLDYADTYYHKLIGNEIKSEEYTTGYAPIPNKNAGFLSDILSQLQRAQDYLASDPVIMMPKINNYDEDSFYRLQSSRKLYKNQFYDKRTDYKELVRLIYPNLIDKYAEKGHAIIQSVILVNYYLNCSIFKNRAILNKSKNSKWNTFIMCTPTCPWLHVYKGSVVTTKTSKLSETSDSEVSNIISNYKHIKLNPFLVALAQINNAYTQSLINGKKKLNQKINTKILYNSWSSVCGECFAPKIGSQRINTEVRISNGLNKLKRIIDYIGELFVTQDLIYIDGMIVEMICLIAKELFNIDVNEELVLTKETFESFIEFIQVVKMILNNKIKVDSDDGFKLISIIHSFVHPLITTFNNENEFIDCQFPIFLIIDRLFNEYFHVLVNVFRCSKSNIFIIPETNVRNIRNVIKDFKKDIFMINDLIDVANIFILSPITVIYLASISKSALKYRCLQIEKNFNEKNTKIFTYLNNIWKSNILKLPWTSFPINHSQTDRMNDFYTSNNNGVLIIDVIKDFNRNPSKPKAIVLESISMIFGDKYKSVYFDKEHQIKFTDIRLINGYLFPIVTAYELQEHCTNFVIQSDYSMIPEFELEVVGFGDGKKNVPVVMTNPHDMKPNDNKNKIELSFIVPTKNSGNYYYSSSISFSDERSYNPYQNEFRQRENINLITY